MQLIDTPNPNAKKLIYIHNFEIAIYLSSENSNNDTLVEGLLKIDGVKSIFTGPGFLTITKEEKADWNLISTDINNNFDKL
ncbi:MAG: NifU N-terminal domain-containing protein [Pelagibacteraceae bacterium]